MAKKAASRRNAAGYTPAQQKKIDELKALGQVVPVGLFGLPSTPEQLQARLAQAGAAGTHASSRFREAAGRTSRVGSRSRARQVAVDDQR